MEWIIVIVGLGLMWLPLFLLFARLFVEEEETPGVEVDAPVSEPGEAPRLLTPRLLTIPRSKDPAPTRKAAWDGTVIWLEDYLKTEREHAERFIAKPSVGSLYKNCGREVSIG